MSVLPTKKLDPSGTETLIYDPRVAETGNDTVTVVVQAHGHAVSATIGLGVDPAIAEQLISSLS